MPKRVHNTFDRSAEHPTHMRSCSNDEGGAEALVVATDGDEEAVEVLVVATDWDEEMVEVVVVAGDEAEGEAKVLVVATDGPEEAVEVVVVAENVPEMASLGSIAPDLQDAHGSGQTTPQRTRQGHARNRMRCEQNGSNVGWHEGKSLRMHSGQN